METIRASEIAADPLCEILKKQLRLGKSVTIQYAGEELFLNVQVPPVRLVLIGAVHIAQTLTQVARLADFDVIVIDPRTAFATAERFHVTELITEWPEVALPAIGLDSYTAWPCSRMIRGSMIRLSSRLCAQNVSISARLTHEKLMRNGSSGCARPGFARPSLCADRARHWCAEFG